MIPRKGDLISITEFGCEHLQSLETIDGNGEREILFGERDRQINSFIIEDIKKWIPEHWILLLEDPEIYDNKICITRMLYADRPLYCVFDIDNVSEAEKLFTVKSKGSGHQ